MNTLLLRDEKIFPNETVLKKALKDNYPAFEEFYHFFAAQEVRLEWRYYRDGKAWLGKLLLRERKNLGWLSVYDDHFRVTFYFPEKHKGKVSRLSITPALKEEFFQQSLIKKLNPLSIRISDKEALKDLSEVLLLKISL